MESRASIYRSLRRNKPFVPARVAWSWANDQIVLQQRIRETGFAWEGGPCVHDKAIWEEQGFTLTASIVADEVGWEIDGVETIGRFQDKWVPGAIEHDRFNARICSWFVPAFPENGRTLYRRACTYGDEWVYVGIEVTVCRAGIELGKDSLWSIESDSDEDHFTQVAFDLADEAVQYATQNLINLCGCN